MMLPIKNYRLPSIFKQIVWFIKDIVWFIKDIVWFITDTIKGDKYNG